MQEILKKWQERFTSSRLVVKDFLHIVTFGEGKIERNEMDNEVTIRFNNCNCDGFEDFGHTVIVYFVDENDVPLIVPEVYCECCGSRIN